MSPPSKKLRHIGLGLFICFFHIFVSYETQAPFMLDYYNYGMNMKNKRPDFFPPLVLSLSTGRAIPQPWVSALVVVVDSAFSIGGGISKMLKLYVKVFM